MKYKMLLIISLICTFISLPVEAHKLIAQSGLSHVQLIELYTSEGCSSCPPADKWISTLKNQKDLWTKFVPVVLHVDYWNDLGWRDGFSSHSMTKRQKDVAETWPNPAVYTPAVVLDGKEWRNWTNGELPNPVQNAPIQILVYQEKNGDFTVTILGLPANHLEYSLKIAKLGMNINSKIGAGENSGKLLEHNFVVLAWDEKKINEKNASVKFHLDDKDNKTNKKAIAVWVEQATKPIPLQATGGYI